MPMQPDPGSHEPLNGPELYIYYRVPAAAAAALEPKVLGLMAHLCLEHPGLQARLLRRPVAAGATQTWMEIWRAESGIDAALQDRIEAAAAILDGSIDGARHVEVFEPFASPKGGALPA